MTPSVAPLAKWQRTLVFVTLLLAFLISLPAFIFYATGYRYDFANQTLIAVTGGLYIQASAPESTVFVNEEPVRNARLFRSAVYVQGLEPGTKRIHVEAPGLDTWVKELPVYPQIVTEVEAFNLPLVPQVRHITPYLTEQNEAVIPVSASSSPVFTQATTTNQLFFATSTATSTWREGSEWSLLVELFDAQASTTVARAAAAQLAADGQFGFATSSESVSTSTAVALGTTTLERSNLRLYEADGEVYVEALAARNRIPHYFCYESEAVVVIDGELELVTEPEATTTGFINRSDCRRVIKMDRQNQLVQGFNFHPSNVNLVLLHLESGLYVTEIDDRAWQNSQPLYLGSGLEFLLHQGRIFVREDNLIFEVFLEIASR